MSCRATGFVRVLDRRQPMATSPAFRFVRRFVPRVALWRVARCIVLGVLALPAVSAFAQTWPTLALPPDTNAFGVGETLVANGIPMRVQVFVSTRSPEALTGWFRQQPGVPLVESTFQNKRVLGRQIGEYYQTVELEASALGTRGLAAVAHLKAAQQNRADTQASLDRWLARMPADTQVAMDLRSQDGGKLSLYRVVVNRQTEALNRERLSRLMADDGYTLERTGGPEENVLFFKGPGKEAMATLRRDSEGRTSIVLNTVSDMELLH